jgi:hypothetical protein
MVGITLLTTICIDEVAEFINVFLDLPQHVVASHCHHQGVVVSSVTLLWMYMDYSPSRVVSCRGMHILQQLTTGRIMIHIHPQYRVTE